MRRFAPFAAYIWWASSVAGFVVFALWAKENLTGDKTVSTALLIVLGAASVLWLPVRHAWAELALEEENRLALAASAHKHVVGYRDNYYLTLRHRLEWVWGAARRCELWYGSDPGRRAGRPIPERLVSFLLYELARLESVQIWAHDSSVPFVFVTERSEELFKGRWQALQIELLTIYGDTCDRDLADLVRRVAPSTPPGVEITARSLSTVESNWRGFNRAMALPRHRAGALWRRTARLTWTDVTRLHLLARAAHEELSHALAPLDVDLLRWRRRQHSRRSRSDLWTDALWAETDETGAGTLSIWVCTAAVLPSPEGQEFTVRLSYSHSYRVLGKGNFDQVGVGKLEVHSPRFLSEVIVESGGAKKAKARVQKRTY